MQRLSLTVAMLLLLAFYASADQMSFSTFFKPSTYTNGNEFIGSCDSTSPYCGITDWTPNPPDSWIYIASTSRIGLMSSWSPSSVTVVSPTVSGYGPFTFTYYPGDQYAFSTGPEIFRVHSNPSYQSVIYMRTDSPTSNPETLSRSVALGSIYNAILGRYQGASGLQYGVRLYYWGGANIQTLVGTVDHVCSSIETIPSSLQLLVGCTSTIFRATYGPSPSSLSFSSVPVGAGVYTSLKYHEGTASVYAGSTIGLGLRLDATTLAIKSILFIPSGSIRATITSIYVDSDATATFPRTPVAFFGTNLGLVVKTQASSLKILGMASTGSLVPDTMTLAVFGLKAHPTIPQTLVAALPAVTIPTGTDASQTQLATLTRTNCSEYSCTQCSDDPYCGWCYAAAACTTRAICTTTWGTSASLCPVASRLSVTSAHSRGGTSVTTLGNYFDISAPTAYSCVWLLNGVTKTTQATITSTTATCATPDYSSAQGSGTVTVYFGTTTPMPWMQALPFTFYACELISNCATCISDTTKPDCGWCAVTATCTSNGICPTTGFTNSSLAFGKRCPATLATPTPTSLSVHALTALSVDVTNFPASSHVYRCDFGQDGSTNPTARMLSSDSQFVTSFRCPLPSITRTLTSTTSYVKMATGTVNVTQGLGAAFELYDCANLVRCDQCIAAAHSECGWCGGASATCYYPATGTCSDPMTTCPQIQAVTPNSSQEWNAQNLALTISGDGFGITSEVRCLFQWGSELLETTIEAGYTSQLVTCKTPVSPNFVAAEWHVSLAILQQPLMTPRPFLVYNCDAFQSCGTCASSEMPDCSWCAQTGQLACTNSTGGCSRLIQSLPLCPTIDSTNPALILARNPTSLNVSGDSLQIVDELEATALRCALATDMSSTSVNTSSVTWIDASTVTCDVMQSDDPGQHVLWIYETATSIPFSESIPVMVADCETISDCDTCVSSGCLLCSGKCSDTCDDLQLAQAVCPVVTEVVPSYADLSGTTTVVVRGTGFVNPNAAISSSKRASFESSETSATATYVCLWGSIPTPAAISLTGVISCTPPPLSGTFEVPLTITLNGNFYFEALNSFEFFTCPTQSSDSCDAGCVANPHCGFCVSSASCVGEAACSADIWQSSCTTASLSQTTSSLDGGAVLTATLSAPLPSYTYAPNVTCSFGPTLISPATFSAPLDGPTTVSCAVPASPSPLGTTVPFSVRYSAKHLSSPQNFVFVDCGQHKRCTQCTAQPNCGWCSLGNKCTVQPDCPAQRWSTKVCPINALAIGLGVGLGVFVLIALALIFVFLARRALKRDGLVIQLREPDYDAIAWGTDASARYRVPEDKWQTLNRNLARRDYLLQLALALNCPATEQDALAKGLVYVACAHGVAPEMIKTVIRAEVAACLEENTLFRSNSVASKMYKFYSRIVGIKYLYHCIARVVLELEVLGKQQMEAVEKGLPKNDNDVSILSVTMELNTEKDIGDDLDTDTNLLQLQLICQKIINVLIKKTLNNIPSPLRQIFVEIDQSVTSKFPGSIEAVYKGLGGLFFLRFVCPAITAPHVYGLLPDPPNPTTQRQLVLITKVIQSIANMQPPGKKEQYMEVMGSFIETSIPRIRQFYDNLREAANINTHTDIYEREIIVPDDVLLNGLAATQTILVNEREKLKTWVNKSHLDEMAQMELITVIDECITANHHVPKKVKTANASTTGPSSSSTKKKKTKV